MYLIEYALFVELKIMLQKKSKKKKARKDGKPGKPKKPKTISELALKIEHEYWKPLIFKIWGDKCTICGKPASTAHHFYPKGTYKMLRFDLDNGVPLCRGCHFRLHFVDTTRSNKIVDRRGMKWYIALTKKAETIMPGAYSKQWVEEEKQRLINYEKDNGKDKQNKQKNWQKVL